MVDAKQNEGWKTGVMKHFGPYSQWVSRPYIGKDFEAGGRSYWVRFFKEPYNVPTIGRPHRSSHIEDAYEVVFNVHPRYPVLAGIARWWNGGEHTVATGMGKPFAVLGGVKAIIKQFVTDHRPTCVFAKAASPGHASVYGVLVPRLAREIPGYARVTAKYEFAAVRRDVAERMVSSGARPELDIPQAEAPLSRSLVREAFYGRIERCRAGTTGVRRTPSATR